MNGLIGFLIGLAVGVIVAVIIYIKNKWARDDLVKARSELKVKETINELLNKELPKNKRGIVNAISESDSRD